jgi:hypothetical protein
LLDLHLVYDATGSTDTVVDTSNSNAVIPSGDGASVKGISPFANATLIGYGGVVARSTEAIVTIGMNGNNLPDPSNGLRFTATGTSMILGKSMFAKLSYGGGNANNVAYANETAGASLLYTLDWIPGIGNTSPGDFDPANPGMYSLTSGALTAGVYKGTVFAPSPSIPAGKWAILGAWLEPLTSAAYLRFQHSDFKGAAPGFPIPDYATGSLVTANFGGTRLFSQNVQGYQFVSLGQILRQPACPVFTAQGGATGLTVQMASPNTDTPTAILNLQRVG